MSSNRESVRNSVLAFHTKDPIFLDTETTGLGASDEVVDIAVVDLAGRVLFESLVKPLNEIPADATTVHGISNRMVEQSPSWPEIWPTLLSILEGKHLGIYNRQFDIKLMRQSCLLHGVPWKEPSAVSFCVMELFAEYYGEWNSLHRSYTWQKLETAGRFFQISIPNSHRAKDDGLLAKEVFLAMGGLPSSHRA